MWYGEVNTVDAMEGLMYSLRWIGVEFDMSLISSSGANLGSR